MFVYTSNKGVLWREIPIEPALISSHHRIDAETVATAASKWSCGYQNKLDLAVYVAQNSGL